MYHQTPPMTPASKSQFGIPIVFCVSMLYLSSFFQFLQLTRMLGKRKREVVQPREHTRSGAVTFDGKYLKIDMALFTKREKRLTKTMVREWLLMSEVDQMPSWGKLICLI